ncbi:hypothetical protein E1B28_005503 [Marasmius oreades]|uniref:Uncharacterized protein n=1 Tax=Marasmius oreades TaxID=181124 RepID=A0A9P7UUM5_9AGAR|nr:uncharacterized protein E1B28_005503 [Marasmius oreades]KAG7094683.1 hypothetical protein E1B28_005503 [Marasmius oreades]
MLPSSLVDLTLARINAPSNLHQSRHFQRSSRYLQSAALKLKPPKETSPAYYSRRNDKDISLKKRSRLEDGGLRVRPVRDSPKAISELSQRVRKLEEVAMEHQAVLDPPAYTEEQLLTIYEDLLSNPEVAPQTVETPVTEDESNEERDQSLLMQLDQRLVASVGSPNSSSESLSSMLRRMTRAHRSHEVQRQHEDVHQEAYLRTLDKVESLVLELDAIQVCGDKLSVSPGVLSFSDWEALMRVALRAEDLKSAQLASELMQKTGLDVTEEHVNTILEYFVERGDTVGFENNLKHYVQDIPTEQQRHLHVKAHLNATSSSTFPTSALSIVHSYENQAAPPPMKTYSKVIHHLLTVPHSTAQAQAWDLFSHMRYVSHPTPDAILYTQMIRACASYYTASRAADPERALDLWTEMCIDNNITPLAGTYNAIILACARSGRKVYVAEAFRLAKQMLDSSRDACGLPAYLPDILTFCALLEGAKRVGDLARVRWILAEMIGEKQRGAADVTVNEKAMMHVFHAYAAYQVPFKRSMALLVEEEAGDKEKEKDNGESEIALQEQQIDNTEALPPVPEARTPLFTHVPPQTHHEVLAEAEILFARILEETGAKVNYETFEDAFVPHPKFGQVQITVRLLNSYLSVHYKHNSLENARTLFWKVYEDLGVQRSARTYQEAMERCANPKRSERATALDFAKKLMDQWKASNMEVSREGEIAPARTIEKLHAAYIKILSLTDNLDQALDHVRSFVARYHPSSVRCSRQPQKPNYRSMRTSLVAARPLVRLSTETEVPDDGVPPLLTFSDLEVLHHRLVAANRGEAIGYIKYICKAYEWALRVRRDETMRARPMEPENKEALVSLD